MFNYIKELLETNLNIRIYRNSLPKGMDPVYEIFKLSNHYNIRLECLFDVGANIGQSTKAFKETFPNLRVHCFEPIQNTFSILKKQTSKLRNVNLHQFALGKINEKKTVHSGERNDLFSLIETSRSGPIEQIILRSLDDIVFELKENKIDILKIDTEGYDLEVLNGAIKTLKKGKIEFIQVEAKLNGSEKRFVHLNEFINFLEPLGYDLMSICNQEGWHLRSPLIYCNALFQKKRDWYI